MSRTWSESSLIIDNTKSDGPLAKNKAAQAIMQYRNIPHLILINLSPAQLLLHGQLQDHIPANQVDYICKPTQNSFSSKESKHCQKYNVSTHQFPGISIGTTVPYHIHLDGSNRITFRNRCFIKPITTNLMKERQIFISPLANPEKSISHQSQKYPASTPTKQNTKSTKETCRI